MGADSAPAEGSAGPPVDDGSGQAPTATRRRLGPVAWLLTGFVRAYQLVVSPWLGPSCRFEPSCSAYAVDALRLHGAARGSWLVLRRLARCQPFCTGGYDPVPEPRRPRRRFPFRRPGVHPPAGHAPTDSSTGSATPTATPPATPPSTPSAATATGPTPEAPPAMLSEIVDPERRVAISEVGNPVGAGSLGRGALPC
jgi:putative membrane protein insertion efficiency factor